MPNCLTFPYILEKKNAFYNFTMLLIWHQTAQNLIFFFAKKTRHGSSVLHLEAKSCTHYVSEAYHTFKVYHSFIVKILKMLPEIQNNSLQEQSQYELIKCAFRTNNMCSKRVSIQAGS